MCDIVDAEFVLFRENSCCTCVHNVVLYNDLKKRLWLDCSSCCRFCFI